MTGKATIEMDGRKMMHSVIVTARITHFREMKIRAWIGARMMLVGAWIMGCQLVIQETRPQLDTEKGDT